MKYRQLGNTDLNVSLICLGSMTWGEQNTEDEGHRQLDYAVTEGVNFIDTAEMYPIPPDARTYGRTETVIGNWLRHRHDRDKLVIATKVAAYSERMLHMAASALTVTILKPPWMPACNGYRPITSISTRPTGLIVTPIISAP